MTETVTTPITLSPAEVRVGTLLIQGLSVTGIARRLHLSPNTVKDHLTRIRRKLGIKRPRLRVLVHLLLSLGLLATPLPGRPAPDLPDEDLALIEALAQEPSLDAIARKTGIPRRKLPARIDRLLGVAVAIGTEHLITLAHGWQLLGHPAEHHGRNRGPVSITGLRVVRDRRPAHDSARGVTPHRRVRTPTTVHPTVTWDTAANEACR